MALTKVGTDVLNVSDVSVALALDPIVNGIKDYVDGKVLSGGGSATTAVDQPAGTNTNVIANTKFVTTGLNLKANLIGPTTFTGVINAPTAAVNDNSTVVANTAYVIAQTALLAPKANPTFTGIVTLPSSAGVCEIKAGTGDGASATIYNVAIRSWWGIGFRDYTDNTTVKAYIDCRSGAIYGQTATAGTSTTQLATTAFVTDAVTTKANTVSPTFTGIPAAPTPSAGTNTTQIATAAFVNSAVSSSAVPTGGIVYVAQATSYPGFIDASGQAVSRVTYAALFAAIGTRYGAGNGSTTFNLPDLRGEFIRGWDNARGVDTGRVLGSAQASSFASHVHSQSYPAWSAVGGGGSNMSVYSGADAGDKNTGPTGGTDTKPRNIALIAVIKY